MIIKKIFDGVFDEDSHYHFLKFSRGEFKNKYLIEAKKQAKKWSVKTSSEFGNFLVKKCLEGHDKILIDGAIISSIDLSEDIKFEIKKKSNFQGIRKFIFNTEVVASDILKMIDKYPLAFFTLSFKTDTCILKIKKKAPNPKNSGGKKGEAPRAEACSLKTTRKDIVDELLFDVPVFKEAIINHTLHVNEIVYPNDVDKLSPQEIRKKSKRKGVIVRNVIVDGIEKVSEAEFVI